MEQNKKFIVFAIISSVFGLFMLIGLDIALQLGVLAFFGISPESIFGDQHEMIGFILFGVFLLADLLLTSWFISKNKN